MKKFKYIILSLVFCLALCPLFTLVGCTKQFTINITIAEGLGSVKRVNSLTHISSAEDLVGENEVKEGENFEYAVAPVEHYHIKYIKVDGKNIEFTVDKDGIARPVFLNIKGNHSVVIGFERNTYSITYYYYDGADYKPLMAGESIYKTSVVYESNVSIAGIKDFGFTRDKEGTIQFTPTSDTFFVNSDTTLYTTKSLEELKTLLGLNSVDAE